MVQNGDKVTVHFEISTLAGKQLYSTYDAGQPLDVEVGQRFDTEGVTEALAMVRKGTSATLIIPSELAFGPEGSGEAIPPYTTMLYNINVVEVTTKDQIQKEQEQKQKEMQMKEQQSRTNEGANILKYMEDNNLSGTPTKSGLYYIEKEKGSGAKPLPGQTVQVHYTGTLLDGSKFDSSVDRGQPFEFQLGVGRVIQGWDEGIALMNIGSKGLLIVPFELGYGSRDMSPQIPAYSTLVFEVELLGIK
jgi:FKBP-type peptidyl-prolyl cis-trans isomerase